MTSVSEVDWQIAPLRTQLEELRSRRRYEEALALCDRILALPLQQKPRLYWENRREDLHFSSVLRAADTAMTSTKVRASSLSAHTNAVIRMCSPR